MLILFSSIVLPRNRCQSKYTVRFPTVISRVIFHAQYNIHKLVTVKIESWRRGKIATRIKFRIETTGVFVCGSRVRKTPNGTDRIRRLNSWKITVKTINFTELLPYGSFLFLTTLLHIIQPRKRATFFTRTRVCVCAHIYIIVVCFMFLFHARRPRRHKLFSPVRIGS